MKTKLLIFILPMLLLYTSCEEQTPELLTEEVELIDEADPVIAHILSLGYKMENIQDLGQYFLVEGDIRFPKDMALYPDGAEAGHYRSDHIVSSGNRNISIYIDMNSFTLDGEDLIQGAIDIKPILVGSLNSAIAAYNNLNADLTFTRVTSPFGADITVKKVSAYYEGGACGAAGFPTANGQPFPTIEIFPLSFNGTTSKLTETLVHEIGHCIGLRHTNGVHENPAPTYIPTTSLFDPASVMNTGGCGTSWGGFSNGDVYAIECLYSLTPGSPCTPPTSSCNTPANPNGITFTSDFQNYLYAQAGITLPGGPADGYEWEVLGGFINGGYGTNQILIVPYCPNPRTLYVSVRAYNLSSTGTKCYSDWVTRSYVYDGRCYLIFG